MIIGLVDKLLDRVIQLFTYEKKKRSELLQNYVTPVFLEFENVHKAYLESFLRYRELIKTSQNPHWINELKGTLEKDNLFTADSRSKLGRLAESRKQELFGGFIEDILNYLMSARVVDPAGKFIFPGHVQRWRQGFIKTLEEIELGRWQMVFDPDGQETPLDPDEIQLKLQNVINTYKIINFNNDIDQKQKRVCAFWALDQVVIEMQQQYDRVSRDYAELLTKLT